LDGLLVTRYPANGWDISRRTIDFLPTSQAGKLSTFMGVWPASVKQIDPSAFPACSRKWDWPPGKTPAWASSRKA